MKSSMPIQEERLEERYQEHTGSVHTPTQSPARTLRGEILHSGTTGRIANIYDGSLRDSGGIQTKSKGRTETLCVRCNRTPETLGVVLTCDSVENKSTQK